MFTGFKFITFLNFWTILFFYKCFVSHFRKLPKLYGRSTDFCIGAVDSIDLLNSGVVLKGPISILFNMLPFPSGIGFVG